MVETQLQALVVDDEKNNREMCRWLLESEGYQVVDAPDGVVALEILKQLCHFHVMILDLRMPVMGGKAVLEHLVQMPSHDDMYVIVSTANPDMMRGLNKRYDYSAPKPLDTIGFTTLVNTLKAGRRVGSKEQR